MVLLPLQNDRIKKQDFMENHMQLVAHFQKIAPQEKEQRLREYVDRQTGCLNMQKFGAYLLRMLKD